MICSLLLVTALFAPQDFERVPVEAPAQTLVGDVVFTVYEMGDIFADLGPDRSQLAAADFEENTERSPEAELGVEVLPKKYRTKIVKDFTRTLERHLDPPFAAGENEIRFVGMSLNKLPSSLIFKGTSQQQAWVAAFLEAHRGRSQFLVIDSQFMAGPRGTFRGSKDESGNRFFENDAEVQAFHTELRAKEGVEIIAAPRITTTPGRRASISAMTQMAYVESVTMRIVEPGGVEIADPEIAVLHEGVAMEIQASPIPKRAVKNSAGQWVVEPGLTLALSITIENASVERPIPTKTVRVNSNRDGEGVQVMMPQVTRISLEAEVRLVQGAGILIGGPSTDEERDVAILIHLPGAANAELQKGR